MDRLTLMNHVAVLALVGGLHSRSRMFFDALGIEYTDCRLRLVRSVNLCKMTRVNYGKGPKYIFLCADDKANICIANN
jgi:hypothetical protein